MQTYFSVAQIVLAVVLILAILFQVRGGGLGGIFGQPDSVYRTRRGACDIFSEYLPYNCRVTDYSAFINMVLSVNRKNIFRSFG